MTKIATELIELSQNCQNYNREFKRINKMTTELIEFTRVTTDLRELPQNCPNSHNYHTTTTELIIKLITELI